MDSSIENDRIVESEFLQEGNTIHPDYKIEGITVQHAKDLFKHYWSYTAGGNSEKIIYGPVTGTLACVSYIANILDIAKEIGDYETIEKIRGSINSLLANKLTAINHNQIMEN